jgi:hypothetical protein
LDLHLSPYQELELSLKTREGSKSKGTRQVFQPYLVVGLEGAYAELASLGPDWTNLQAGVSQLRLVPAGEPSSLPPNATYLLSGCAADKYLSGKNCTMWFLSDPELFALVEF